MLYEFPTNYVYAYIYDMMSRINNRGSKGSANAPRSSKRQAVSLPVLTDFYGLPRGSELVVAETMNEDEIEIAPAILMGKKNAFIDLQTGQQMPCNNTFFDTNITKDGGNVVFSAVDVNARAHISKRYLINSFNQAVIR